MVSDCYRYKQICFLRVCVLRLLYLSCLIPRSAPESTCITLNAYLCQAELERTKLYWFRYTYSGWGGGSNFLRGEFLWLCNILWAIHRELSGSTAMVDTTELLYIIYIIPLPLSFYFPSILPITTWLSKYPCLQVEYRAHKPMGVP